MTQKNQDLTATPEQETDYTCPRCLGQIPNNDEPGAYLGALSRLTRDGLTEPAYICSDCGADEAMGKGYVPLDLWPVVTESTPTEVLESRDYLLLTLIRSRTQR